MLYQIPSWLLATLVLFVLHQWEWISLPVAVLLFALLLVKDAVLFPLTRAAYEDRSEHGPEALVGARAVAEQPLDPTGYVRIGSERWQARMARGEASAAAGEWVEVLAVERLTLRVRRASEPRTSR
ncbi:MAG: NfeD family protein [Proteobacteria bacterium]|nr:NfeD family protein [Pseudomonadota bacterium]